MSLSLYTVHIEEEEEEEERLDGIEKKGGLIRQRKDHHERVAGRW